MVIAVRYCAVRKQFGPPETEEWPVLEYQALVIKLSVIIVFYGPIKLINCAIYSTED